MRTAETVLNIIRNRGERGLPLEDIYRQLYNRELYLRAYGRLYSNQGATTKGTTAETMDGMSLDTIDRLIDALRYERFRWTPVRRVKVLDFVQFSVGAYAARDTLDISLPVVIKKGRTSCWTAAEP